MKNIPCLIFWSIASIILIIFLWPIGIISIFFEYRFFKNNRITGGSAAPQPPTETTYRDRK